MRILFTGASSFTGYWFVKELVQAGHEVICTFRASRDSYQGARRHRVESICALCETVFDVVFGTEAFLQVVQKGQRWDLLCHHAADVTNYKSPDFDVAAALQSNTRGLPKLLEILKNSGCHRVLLTDSVFEQGEGVGGDGLRAFSPYGLSKGLTAQVFRYYAHQAQMKLGNFIIPNPFGPYEEMRFTSYIAQSWLHQKIPVVATPSYIRDNIHVSLLVKCYSAFASQLTSEMGSERCAPSGYAESQGAFTARFASAMRPRLQLPCEFQLLQQKEFPEPMVRLNTDVVIPEVFGWNESQAWDELADYYQHAFQEAVKVL